MREVTSTSLLPPRLIQLAVSRPQLRTGSTPAGYLRLQYGEPSRVHLSHSIRAGSSGDRSESSMSRKNRAKKAVGTRSALDILKPLGRPPSADEREQDLEDMCRGLARAVSCAVRGSAKPYPKRFRHELLPLSPSKRFGSPVGGTGSKLSRSMRRSLWSRRDPGSRERIGTSSPETCTRRMAYCRRQDSRCLYARQSQAGSSLRCRRSMSRKDIL
jgi:hypothetical protein